MDFAFALFGGLVITGGVVLWDRLQRRKESSIKGRETIGVESKATSIVIEYARAFFPVILIVFVLRSFIVEPFRIPSGSMLPSLYIGDFILVSKFSYGIRLPLINQKVLSIGKPKRGEVIVFKTPADNRTDYIKRLIGIPGDSLQIIDGELYLNDKKIQRSKIDNPVDIYCGNEILKVNAFEETFPSGKKYLAVYRKEGTMLNSDKFVVPDNHYFFMGDNRDCSKDSRFLSSVGYVHFNNLVGRANIIFFSNDKAKGSFFKFWQWNKTIRIKRFFKKIK